MIVDSVLNHQKRWMIDENEVDRPSRWKGCDQRKKEEWWRESGGGIHYLPHNTANHMDATAHSPLLVLILHE